MNLKVAKDSLKEGKSVIIDNTNPSKSARKEFLKLAVAASEWKLSTVSCHPHTIK